MPYPRSRSDNRSRHPSLYATSTLQTEGDVPADSSFPTVLGEPYKVEPHADHPSSSSRYYTGMHSPPSSPLRDRPRYQGMESSLGSPSTSTLKQHHPNTQYERGRPSPVHSSNTFAPHYLGPTRLSNNRSSAHARPDGVEILHLIDPLYSGLVPTTSSLSVNTHGTDSGYAARRGSPVSSPEFSKAYVDAQGRLHDPDYRAFDVDFAPNSRSPRSSSRQHHLPFEKRGVGTRRSSEIGLLAASDMGRRGHGSPSYRESMTLEDDEGDGTDYDSDADVTLPRKTESSFSLPMAHTASSIPANTSRRYSKPNALGSDSGYTETAATPPPLGPDTPSSSLEHASPGIMTEFPTRPRPTRELSRNTLYPRTPATRYFSSQLQNNVIRRPPSPITPRAISLRSTSSSSISGDLSMPGMKETDDPYKKITVTDSEQDSRPMTPIANGSSHLRTSPYGLLQPGIKGKKRKKKKRPDTHTEVSLPEKHKPAEEGLVASSVVLEKQPSTGPLRPFQRPYPAVSLTGLSSAERPPNATDYIPSHHGKARSLRPGAEPLHTDDFTPTCMDGLKRSWQSFKLTLRFGAFRTRRRIKRRVGLT